MFHEDRNGQRGEKPPDVSHVRRVSHGTGVSATVSFSLNLNRWTSFKQQKRLLERQKCSCAAPNEPTLAEVDKVSQLMYLGKLCCDILVLIFHLCICKIRPSPIVNLSTKHMLMADKRC